LPQAATEVFPAGAGLDGRRLERFRREAQAAARLQHPHIVPVHEMGVEGGLYYFAMQLVDGTTLHDVLPEVVRLRSSSVSRSLHAESSAAESSAGESSAAVIALSLVSGGSGRLAPAAPSRAASAPKALRAPAREYFRSAGRVALEVAEALAYAHGQGVLHRDLKPSNVLLDARGQAWLADFGLAKLVELEDLTQSGELVGTLRYMAPERFRGALDARSDVYSLGLTIYELLAARPAFAAETREELVRSILEDEPPLPRALDPAIPLEFEAIVLKAIEKRPERRYGSALELAEDLRRFLGGERPHGPPARALRVARRALRRHRWLLATLLAALAALAVWSLVPVDRMSVGAFPLQVLAADLDGDGDQDLVTANGSSGDLSLLRNRGGRRFRGAVSIPAGEMPRCLAALDLDRDGDLDLVAANQTSKSLSVRLGDGRGGFGPGFEVPLAERPNGLAAGDLDADGAPDLAVSGGRGLVWVLLGRGEKGGGPLLGPPREIEAPPFPNAIALADLDQDGDPDLALTSRSGVAVLRNQGGGAFGAGSAAPGTEGGWTNGLAAHDLDGDGHLDLAVTRLSEKDGVLESVWMLRADGAGGFGPPSSIPAGSPAEAIAAHDLDGDADVDLAVAGGASDVVILLNRGGGAFEPGARLRAPGGPTWLAAADLDQDGRADLAVACGRGSEVRILWGAALPRP
jgi:hypothetical protein